MKLIALEEHYVTEEIRDAWKKLDPQWQDLSGAQYTPEIVAQLEDFGPLRLERMDAAGVDVQVISLGPGATQSFEPEQAVSFAVSSNNYLAKMVATNPDRFQGFATLPTPDPAAAARELTRCVEELGFQGALLCGRTRNRPLDAPEFFPIYAEAARLKVPLYIHPQSPQVEVLDAYYRGFNDKINNLLGTFGWGWHLETAVQSLRFILSGVLDRLPDLQLILGHWGEMLVFYLERIDAMSKAASLGRSIPDYLRQNFYVTPSGMFSQRYLRETVEVMGVDRILFSTDYPFLFSPDGGARRLLTESSLSPADQEKIAHGNWERLRARG